MMAGIICRPHGIRNDAVPLMYEHPNWTKYWRRIPQVIDLCAEGERLVSRELVRLHVPLLQSHDTTTNAGLGDLRLVEWYDGGRNANSEA